MKSETDAQAWLENHGWWTGAAGDRLRHFVALVLVESDQQNLISAGTRESIWLRHVVDSAQLLALSGANRAGPWIDLGTGAGFPGLVVACLRDEPMHLVEARPLRARFLEHCAQALGLGHVTVHCAKVERVDIAHPAAILSARAFAPLDRLLVTASRLANRDSLWLLPKGRQGKNELEKARRDWQAVFHVEQSLTDSESVILTIIDLQRRQIAQRERRRR